MLRACLVLLALALWGCNSLDDDSMLTPQWQASYFVVRDTSLAGQPTQLLRISPQGLSFNWNNTPAPTCAAANDAFLWVTTATGQLLRHDLRRQQLLAQPLPEAMSCLALGQQYVLLGAATTARVYFAHQVMGLYSYVPLALDFIPQGVRYNAGKFVVYGQSAQGLHIALFDEAAAAKQRTWLIPNRQLVSLAYDNVFRLQFITKPLVGSTYTTHGLDPGSATLDEAGLSVTEVQAQYTPYAKKVHAGNYLGNIKLGSNQRLSLTAITDLVQHFETDFNGGILYYQKGDSLVRYDLHANKRLSAWQLPNSASVFLAAVHHYQQP